MKRRWMMAGAARGSATASRNQPARIVVTALDTGAVVLDDRLAGTKDRAETVDLTKTMTLDPGRYRARLSGSVGKPCTNTIMRCSPDRSPPASAGS
jgi:hypothetical protein